MSAGELMERAKWIYANCYQDYQSYLRKEISYVSWNHAFMKYMTELQQIFEIITDFNHWILEYEPYLETVNLLSKREEYHL